jgi:hypothetical protein
MALGRSAIEAQILGLQPDNTEQLISPLDNRDSFQLVIDNFVNLEDNQFTNGLNIDGVSGDIGLGGALSKNTTIEGGGFYSFTLNEISSFNLNASVSNDTTTQTLNGSSFNLSNVRNITFPTTYQIASIFQVSNDNIQVYNLNGSNNSGAGFFAFSDITYFQRSNGSTGQQIRLDDGIILIDDEFNRGALYSLDYSSNYVARSLTDKAYQDGHVAGVTASALAQNPTATEDGFALVYNHGTTSYTLASVGGGGTLPISDNRIPVGNATNDGIENSVLQIGVGNGGNNESYLRRRRQRRHKASLCNVNEFERGGVSCAI